MRFVPRISLMADRSQSALALKRLREQSGLSVAEMAKKLGKVKSTYAHYEDGYKKPFLPAELVNAILPILTARGIAESEIIKLSGISSDPRATPTQRPAVAPTMPQEALGTPLDYSPLEIPMASTFPKNLPVMGVASGGPGDAEFAMNGQIIDYVRRPDSLRHISGAFGLYVTGSSMHPRFEEGELVFVNPTRIAKIGDDVIVELFPTGDDESVPGPAFIKRLHRKTSTATVFYQFNPPLEIPIDPKTIKKIYRIMTAGELLGM